MARKTRFTLPVGTLPFLDCGKILQLWPFIGVLKLVCVLKTMLP